jgi:hypothetical protein
MPQLRPSDACTLIDFIPTPGSDSDRPGLAPTANLNIGIGHTFRLLKKAPLVTNLCSPIDRKVQNPRVVLQLQLAFDRAQKLGVMKNFNLSKTEVVTGYMRQASAVSRAMTRLRIFFCDGESSGTVIHLNAQKTMWVQETYIKIPTVPWSTTTGIGFIWSW